MRSVIIMLSGMPGTGKSTAAKKLAQSLGYSLVSLIGIRQSHGYKKHDRRRTRSDMNELYVKTCQLLIAKENIILDSVFLSSETRGTYFELAEFVDAQVIILACVCSELTAKSRMKARPKNCGLIMEPRDPKVYDKLLSRMDWIKEKDLPAHVSYLLYETVSDKIWEIHVADPVRLVVDAIKNCLDG